jgi:prepilin-type N-terminal cleavage/methylation domain-containing protein
MRTTDGRRETTPCSSHMRNARGFSLVEVLVALLLTGILTAAMFRVYINQHHAWMIQDSVIDMQQNARTAIDELTRQVRMAGYGLPNGMTPLMGYNTNPDTIVLFYKTANCDAPIEHAMPNPSAELRCDGHDVSCFHVNQRAYIYDPTLESGEFFTITQVQTSSSHIQHNTTTLSRSYPQGSIIMYVAQVQYYIDRTDTLHPNLMVRIDNGAPQVYAENITDLQFKYMTKNGAIADVPTVPKDVRKIGIQLFARTPLRDPTMTATPYRYREYASNVYLRNIGI